MQSLDDIHDLSGESVSEIFDENNFEEEHHLEQVRTGMRAGFKSQPKEPDRLQIRHEKRDTKRARNDQVFTDDAGTIKLIFKVPIAICQKKLIFNFSQKQRV